MSVNNSYVITLDIDWAPDWAIDYVAQILIEKNVKATWFVTHDSKAIGKLKEREDLFELGIHPNMLEGSSHGKSADEVLSHITDIVPNAVSMRTHGLYQSTSFLIKAAKDYGIKVDTSLFLPRMSHLKPHLFKLGDSNLWRVPYFWEDDSEMFEEDSIWELSDERLNVPGLRIFDFHPIHIVLNTNEFNLYRNLKEKNPVTDWNLEATLRYANKGSGPKNIFFSLIEKLSNGGTKIKDIVSGN